MRAKNLDTEHGTPAQDWTTVAGQLDEGVLLQAPESGGPNRFTCWLTTINADGSPHVTPVGGAWVDGAFWFQTGEGTRKAKNVARDARCTMSVATRDFDLVVEGTAELVTDSEQVSRVADVWRAGGWPCEVDASGRLTAPFNAPAVGPAPWNVYRITPRSALSVSTVEPGGATRWTW